MNEGEKLIEFTKVVLNRVSELDNIIDEAIEPIKDYTETIEDIAVPIKSFFAIYNLKKKLAFKSFVINYSKQINDGYEIDEKETKKLISFFSNKRNVTYISEIIDNAINAKSLKSTALLGVIAGKFIKEKDIITYQHLSIIDSLKAMTDFDLENFVALCDYLKTVKTAHKDTSEYRTEDFFSDDNENKPNIKRESLEFTIEKLKRTNGLTYNTGGIGQAGNSKGSFETNEITSELYKLIVETKILD
ncbi:hypothetical protein [Riemerella anatipestifer]|uniref:Uncharacterized protein n=1 Tax=Riemerella anatipestifer TaxID=34085 RepID=A0A1S7DUL5_RIEAN|nr:hypothetical protein [Riemerella anatipestifer]AQY22806.1 hypothetical protein AB406_1865 [Riemerella anatipestifer]MBO4232843.1 hypothetical protein [Riemerella anatipestifer]